MNVGDRKYFKVTKSLGELKVIEISSWDITNVSFGMQLTKTDLSYEYGTHEDYQIELFHNGTSSDIAIKGKEFSYIINSSLTSYRTRSGLHNRFTIEYVTGGNKKAVELDSYNGSESGCILCDIVYALILLSEIDDSEKVLEIHTFLFNLNENIKGTLGHKIDIYKEIKAMQPELVEKYPFIANPINRGLNKRLDKIKENLLLSVLTENDLIE